MKFWISYFVWAVAVACILVYGLYGFCLSGGIKQAMAADGFLIMLVGMFRATVGTLFTAGILLALWFGMLYFSDSENEDAT